MSDVRPIATQTDLVLPNADDAFLSVLQAFGELTQQLKALKTLPLELNDVWAMDAALRGCAVAVPDVSRPLDVLLQFVNSTAWPDDLEAIRKLYHSFRLKMADEIRTARCVVQHDCLDVHFRGYVFRLHIYLAKEVMLLRNARLAAEHRLRTHARAVHSSAVGGFQVRVGASVFFSFVLDFADPAVMQMKNNSFGQTVRLCERWLHAHLLSDKMTGDARFFHAARCGCVSDAPSRRVRRADCHIGLHFAASVSARANQLHVCLLPLASLVGVAFVARGAALRGHQRGRHR